ncbi:MAG TPA: phage Gp37/Gp68 family protein, partial [Hyalangium sp.]|nr:phage Gp37/Gp68 family protein [Hyalangium sp.]
ERMAERLQAMGQPNYRNGFELTLQPQMLELPLQWKKPQTIFVNSMSDLFHKDVPLAYIQRVFSVMNRAHWHRFQVLTKRANRLAELSPEINWPTNVWMGVSVENSDYVDRIDDLRSTGAHVKFLSLEPLLGPLPKLKLRGIDWVIVGGESGPRSRPMDPAWVIDIRDQCRRAGVAFFFKQWGGKNKKKAGRVLEGRTWDEMPNVPEPARAARTTRVRSLPVMA